MDDSDQSRVITVDERGQSAPARFDDRDVAAVKQAGSRKAGVVWPRADSASDVVAPETTPLLSVTRIKAGLCTVKAGNVVGFVGLPSGRVLHVRSKLGDVGVFWLLAQALDVARLIPRWPDIPAKRDNFVDALLLLLRQEVRALVHSGLRKDYVPIEETMGVVRGRVLPARTLTETRGLAHRVTCLYDDFTVDVFDNQVLRLALRAGASRSSDLRATLLGTDALFEGEVAYEPMSLGGAADRLKRLMDARHPSRRTYVPAHCLAYLVLRLLAFSDFGSSTRQPGVLLNMEKLYEMALRNMLTREFEHKPFSTTQIVFGETTPPVAKGLKPDIALRGLLVDAKYKERPLTPRGNGNGLQPPDSDVFQAHTYSYFGQRPCALVYAIGVQTPHRELLGQGLPQAGRADPPRVGVFALDISGSIKELEASRTNLIRQLQRFVASAASHPASARAGSEM